MAFVLLGAWGVWFFRAKIMVIETSEAARLEVDRAAHAVDASVAGKIVSSRLAIGLVVAAGDVLVELDTEPERKRLAEEKTRLALKSAPTLPWRAGWSSGRALHPRCRP